MLPATTTATATPTIMGTGTVITMPPDRDLHRARRRLWQLISPTLPVGAYSYSSGLEYAVDAGWLRDATGVHEWIRAQLLQVHAAVDLPALIRLHSAWATQDSDAVEHWNAWLQASRESAELRAEDLGQGRALARLLGDLGIDPAASWAARDDACWATLFALAAVVSAIPQREMLEGYLWAWCENQVAAAIKLVPLGQTDGQRLLWQLADTLGGAADHALQLDDDAMGGGLPGVLLSSTLHETQYSRMFRS
jgi:urease accessory protein